MNIYHISKKEFLVTLFRLFNSRKLSYFVMGVYQYLPEDTGGSDIDIVVAEKDLVILKKILETLIVDKKLCLASYYTNETEYAVFYRILSSDWGVQIDIIYKGFYYNGIEFYPLSLLKGKIIQHNKINVLNEQVGFYVNFYKEILYTGKAKERYINAFLSQVQSNESNYRTEIIKLYGQESLSLIFENMTFDGLNNISRELQFAMQKFLLKGNYMKSLKTIIKRFGRLFHFSPGYVIVVEGTDGSGKSSIIKAITPVLNEAFHNGVIYNHLRPNFIPDLGVLLKTKKKTEVNVENTNPHGQHVSSFGGSIIRWGYYMIDYTFGYFKVVWPVIHTRSKVFIFDRYYYDYYFDQKRSRTSLPFWLIRLGEFFIPKPDLILCLGGDPKKIYERKPETNLNEVKIQIDRLKSFCQKRDNAIWINTTCPLRESVSTTMNAIIDMMSVRFSCILNYWCPIKN